MVTSGECTLVHTCEDGRKLYIGSRPASYKNITIPDGLSLIVCASGTPGENKRGTLLLHCWFPDSRHEEDVPDEATLGSLMAAMASLSQGGDILFHCQAGMNRSALLCALFLLTYYSDEFWDEKDLVRQLREKRSPLLQNSWFEKKIAEWGYTRYLAQQCSHGLYRENCKDCHTND